MDSISPSSPVPLLADPYIATLLADPLITFYNGSFNNHTVWYNCGINFPYRFATYHTYFNSKSYSIYRCTFVCVGFSRHSALKYRCGGSVRFGYQPGPGENNHTVVQCVHLLVGLNNNEKGQNCKWNFSNCSACLGSSSVISVRSRSVRYHGDKTDQKILLRWSRAVHSKSITALGNYG